MRFPLVFLFLASCFFINCSKEETCTLEDWYGTYRGVKTVGQDIEDDYLFAVTASNLPPNGAVVTIVVDGEIVILDNCAIRGGAVLNIGDSAEGSLSDGELRLTIQSLGTTRSWVGTKI